MTTDVSSGMILGHGWANQGYAAAESAPTARGVGWLLAADGAFRRMEATHLSDHQVAG